MCSLESTAFCIPIVEKPCTLHFPRDQSMDELPGGCALFALTSLLSTLALKATLTKNKRNIEPIGCAKVTTSYKAARNVYDAIIVGAGPAGATAAYFMGKKGMKVALIDKKSFPRHKPCGDAWCKPALDILEEMGVLSKMERDGIARPVKRGGFISPFGYKCINTDGDAYGSVTGCKTYAIKRFIADEYLVNAATAWPSVDYFPLTEVTDLTFLEGATSADADSGRAGAPVGMWSAATKSDSLPLSLTGVVCLICDGSTSYLAQKVNH
jgi:flavin-dependent dehydrogenase